MAKYDIKQVPRETLEKLGRYMVQAFANEDVVTWTIERNFTLVQAIMNQAKVKLRTKDEVDAHIASTVRSYVAHYCGTNDSLPSEIMFDAPVPGRADYFSEVIGQLLAEETEG